MGQTGEIVIAKAVSSDDQKACLAIRREVFIEEQSVPEDREVDGLDEEALHFLVRHKGALVGTARVRFKDAGQTAKIERVAIVKSARGLKVGNALMRFIEADGEIRKRSKIVLEAQSYIVPFYERLGYKASGDEFMDAGIPHRFMSKLTS